MSTTSTFIVTAFLDDSGYALGSTIEAAKEAYVARFGEPQYGISTVLTAEQVNAESLRVSRMMGCEQFGCMPKLYAYQWVIVTTITEEAVEELAGKENAGKLMNCTDEHGNFFIDVRPRYLHETRSQRRARMGQLKDVEGKSPSTRQREWALRSCDWQCRMDLAAQAGDISLTQDEIDYVRAIITRNGTPLWSSAIQPSYRMEHPA